jgi:hypothetical protein
MEEAVRRWENMYVRMPEDIRYRPEVIALASDVSELLRVPEQAAMDWVCMGMARLTGAMFRAGLHSPAAYTPNMLMDLFLFSSWAPHQAEKFLEALKKSGIFSESGRFIFYEEMCPLDLAKTIRRRDRNGRSGPCGEPETFVTHNVSVKNTPLTPLLGGKKNVSGFPKKADAKSVEAAAAACEHLLPIWVATHGKQSGRDYKVTSTWQRVVYRALEDYELPDLEAAIRGSGLDRFCRESNSAIGWILRIGSDQQGNPIDNVGKLAALWEKRKAEMGEVEPEPEQPFGGKSRAELLAEFDERDSRLKNAEMKRVRRENFVRRLDEKGVE